MDPATISCWGEYWITKLVSLSSSNVEEYLDTKCKKMVCLSHQAMLRWVRPQSVIGDNTGFNKLANLSQDKVLRNKKFASMLFRSIFNKQGNVINCSYCNGT